MMTGPRKISGEQLAQLKKKAFRGEMEFAFCGLVLLLSPGFILTLILFWLIYRGSDLARMLACAKALLLIFFALILLFNARDPEPISVLIICALMLLWGAAGAIMAFSTNLQAYQKMNRLRARPVRRRRG
ncbi:MAG: hypothetical protein ACYTGZ_20930 [Planctomycetota bacterium]|jgi:hypothetical protein